MIVAMGSVCDTIEETIDYLLAAGEKVGVVKVRLYRPFCAEALIDAIPDTVKTVSSTHLDVYKRQCGMKAGISIKPDTPVYMLHPYLREAEMFLIMSVEPGFGGQAFLPYSLNKIRELRGLLDERGLDADIEVDGGIYHRNVRCV